jgi:hypothetical protein
MAKLVDVERSGVQREAPNRTYTLTKYSHESRSKGNPYL